MTIYGQKQQLKVLFKQVQVFNDDLELMSHWAKYLCVLTSGFIENSVKHYLLEYSRKKSNSNVFNFTTNNLKKFQNPKMEIILKLFGSFNEDWRSQLEEFVEGERKDAVDSIVNNRHNIAHGKSIGLTIIQMKTFFDRVIEVLDFIEIKCDC